jgi:hypothetical protein
LPAVVATAKTADMRRIFVFGLLILLVLAGAVLFIEGRKPAAPWFAAVSNGNAYDGLVQAATQMNGVPPDDNTEAATFVKANERMFERVHSALKLPFEVPLRMYSATNSTLPDLANFKMIARALRAKGAEAELRRATAEAAATYTEIIQLGQRVEHGPLIALLVGVAIEKIGLTAVEKVAPALTPAERKELADQIESLDRERLPFSEVIQRERFFARQITQNPIRLVIAAIESRPAMKKAAQKPEHLSADFQRVAKELASPK